MPYVQPQAGSPYEQNLSYLLGQSPQPYLGGGAPAGGAGTVGGTAQVAGAPVAPAGPQTSFGAGGGLFAEPERGLSRATETLGGIRESFYGAAGPSRAGLDVKPTLSSAIYGAPTREQTEAGRSLIQAAYGGPAGFDPERSQELLGQFEPLHGYREAFSRGGLGRQTLVAQAYPGLTMGEARFEAQHLGQSLQFRQQAEETAARIQRLFGVAGAEERAAREFAEARTAEEQDIARRSREYVTGEKGALTSGLEDAVRVEEERQRAAQAAWNAFRSDPTRENLLALANVEPSVLDFETASRFISPSYAEGARAEEAWRAIMERYPRIKEFEPLELGISGHGREKLKFQKADVKELAGELGIKRKQVKKELKTRQKELEAAGFTPRTMRAATRGGALPADPFARLGTVVGRETGLVGPVTTREEPLGQFAPYKPLYFGEPFEGPNLMDYLGFDPGQKPEIQNIATDEQRGIYNRIQDLLGEVDRLDKAGEPYRAARVLAEVDAFLADEEAQFEKQKESVSKGAQSWRKLVRRARGEYNKARKAKNRGDVLRRISGIRQEGLYTRLGGAVGT